MSDRRLQFFVLTAIVAVSVTAGMFIASGLNLAPVTAASQASPAGLLEVPPAALPSFADIAERANPAVISITATSLVRSDRRGRFFDPFEYFFGPNPDRRRQGEEEDDGAPDRRQDSGGSGFIISPDGYILTNNHVIDNADRVEVRLAEENREYRAEVVGTDAATDLALLKIDAGKTLPVIPLGDSDASRVGEWVVAIGNPLAWDHTVTVGVISAKGRRLNRDASFDDFIQTDAAINFGNSGGPLLNVRGEAIGINTAIAPQGQGIGFAIPINMAKTIMDQLKENGRVSRGFLGITIRDIGQLSEDERESFGLSKVQGAFVDSVQEGLPADEAGIRHGDAITAVDGEPVDSSSALIEEITRRAPDERVELSVVRDGKNLTLTAELIDREDASGSPGQPRERQDSRDEGLEDLLGFRVEPLSPQATRSYDLDPDVRGVLVTEVNPAGDAYDRGLRPGAVITEVNRTPVESMADFRREMANLGAGDLVNFYIRTGTVSRFLVLRLGGGE